MGRLVGRARRGKAMVELTQITSSLQTWLLHTYDVWWQHGADRVRGGFHERLNHDLTSTQEPRRARLHPRQAFAYAHASRLRWSGPSSSAVEHALRFFMAHYRREDGLFRTLVSPDGAVLDDGVLLYDQAFALLGLAAGYATLRDERCRQSGVELYETLHARLAHPTVGFNESFAAGQPLTANSHMHLLEASLAWAEIDRDPRWSSLAAQLVELALTRLIDPRTGALPEFFSADWQPEPERVVEPGHQFEWAWLLMRFNASAREPVIERAALRLIEIGESHGVHRKRRAAIASLAADFSVRDPHARLWSQCERIKAACGALALTGAAQYRAMTTEATETLVTYLDTPVRGLWRDRLDAWGTFIDEPAPASSLYHLVGTVLELSRVAEPLSPIGKGSRVSSAGSGAATRNPSGRFADR
jgi:mannose/cellobiose epimerase-like protein (N-acyl-D-glucosamine 2-epimerase family)